VNYRKLVPDREQRGIMWMIIGLVVAVPVVFAAFLAFKVRSWTDPEVETASIIAEVMNKGKERPHGRPST